VIENRGYASVPPKVRVSVRDRLRVRVRVRVRFCRSDREAKLCFCPTQGLS
jgi:hypothetical protein